MQYVPHLVAQNIIYWISTNLIPIGLKDVNDYSDDRILLSIEEDSNCFLYVSLFYIEIDLELLKTLRLVHTSFLDCLRLDMIERKFNIAMFRNQYSEIIRLNDSLAMEHVVYAFPQSIDSPLYEDWQIHVQHSWSGGKRIIIFGCEYCIDDLLHMENIIALAMVDYIILDPS
jgi:hypothetical protein